MDPAANWEQQYEQEVAAPLAAVMIAAQVAAAREADLYIAEVLNELGIGEPTTPGVVRPMAFAGVAGDGRPVGTLLDGAVVHAGRNLNEQRRRAIEGRDGDSSITVVEPISLPSAEEALLSAEHWLDMVARTIVADTARAAEAAAMVQRPWVAGWVRMLNPPSCSRCAVLAGRFYLWNEGFLRHPACDCVHIPATEADSQDLRVNPDAYFRSLDEAQQDRIFTRAGANAIRDGADIFRVVNARRGMHTAQQNPRGWIPKGRLTRTDAFGRQVFLTTEGVTGRGAGRSVRLMPESIYEIADGDRSEAIRLLQIHGYVTT